MKATMKEKNSDILRVREGEKREKKMKVSQQYSAARKALYDTLRKSVLRVDLTPKEAKTIFDEAVKAHLGEIKRATSNTVREINLPSVKRSIRKTAKRLAKQKRKDNGYTEYTEMDRAGYVQLISEALKGYLYWQEDRPWNKFNNVLNMLRSKYPREYIGRCYNEMVANGEPFEFIFMYDTPVNEGLLDSWLQDFVTVCEGKNGVKNILSILIDDTPADFTIYDDWEEVKDEPHYSRKEYSTLIENSLKGF